MRTTCESRDKQSGFTITTHILQTIQRNSTKRNKHSGIQIKSGENSYFALLFELGESISETESRRRGG